MLKKLTALYIRVSTAEQAKEGFGLEAQKTKLHSYCDYKSNEDDSYKDIKLYCDAGLSGKDTKNRSTD